MIHSILCQNDFISEESSFNEMALNEVLPSLQPQREDISTEQASPSSDRPSDSQDETGGEYFED